MARKTERIAFRVEPSIFESLEDLADIKGVSVSYLAREIVKRSVRARSSQLKLSDLKRSSIQPI